MWLSRVHCWVGFLQEGNDCRDALRDACNDGVVTLYEVRPVEFLMSTSHTSKSVDASVPLNMRIKPATRNLIDRAAELLGKTRTDFMLEASERRAEEVLLDRAIFTVSPEVHAEYLARLDAPAQINERLKRTMSSKRRLCPIGSAAF